MQPHLIRHFAIFGCALVLCGFAAPILLAQTAPTKSSHIELEQLNQFIRSFEQNDLPSIELPPQLLDSALREKYLPNLPSNDLADFSVESLTETASSISLENYQSDLLPQSLDQQLVLLAAQTPGVAMTHRKAELLSPIQNPEMIQRVRFLIRAVVYGLENQPEQVRPLLDALHAYMNYLENDNLLWQRDNAVVCLDMLERRIIFWEQILVVRLQQHEAIQVMIASPREARQSLREWTTLAHEFLLSNGISPHGARLAQEWEIAALEQLLVTCDRDSDLTIAEATELAQRATRLVARLNPTSLSAQEKRLLNVPGIPAWRKTLAVWSIETTESPMTLLRAIETFETSSTLANETALRAAIAETMQSSSAEVADFGKTVQSLYRSPNLKLYLSTVLLNHLLPTPEREYMRFRDVVAGRDVAGKRRVDTQICLVTIPDSEAIKFAIQARGRVAALGTSSAMSATLHSVSSAEYFGQKTIQWTDHGFRTSPAVVSVQNTRTALRSVQPGVAFPFLGSVVSGAVRNQYEMRQEEITAETRGKIVQQARAKINGEVDAQFLKINKWYQENVERAARDLGMTITLSEARSDANWLLPAWRIGREGSLSLYAPAPETPFGAFADIKIHESTFNILFDSLDVGGQTLAIGELRKQVGEKLRQKEFLLPGDHDEMMVCLAEERPLRVRFYQNSVEIALSVQLLKLNQQTMRDFQIFATYTPQEMPDGTLHLVRDGIVRLGGDILPRHQVPLRTIFGKVFAPQRTFPMAPAFLASDPRFDGLKLGESRIDGGWLAVALILTNEPDGEAISSTNSDETSSTAAPRILRRAVR